MRGHGTFVGIVDYACAPWRVKWLLLLWAAIAGINGEGADIYTTRAYGGGRVGFEATNKIACISSKREESRTKRVQVVLT